MKTIGQRLHGTSDQRRVIGLKQLRFRIERGPAAAVLLFIERIVERVVRGGRASRSRYCERCGETRRGHLRP